MVLFGYGIPPQPENTMRHEVQFDTATEAVIDKVRKLLNLAKNNDNEHQAEAAANKARELLEA